MFRLLKNSFLFNFGLALLFVALAAVTTLLIPALGEGGMYFLFLAAIICSTLYSDWRSGVLAIILAFAGNLLLLDHQGKLLDAPSEWIVLLAFGLASALTVYICYRQVESEIARRLAENRYRAIFENAMTGIYETTVGGSYAAANPKLAAILGFSSADELVNKSANLDEKFYVEENRREKFKQLVNEGGGISGFESEVYRQNGERIWITENAVAVRDRAGALIGFQGTTIEITDRKCTEEKLKEAQQQLETKVVERTAELKQMNEALTNEIAERRKTEISLRHSEEKFRALVEVSSELIWEINENSVCTYISPNIADFLGYSARELIGRTPFFLMPAEEAQRMAKIVKQIGAKREKFVFLEIVYLHKNGCRIISESSGVPFYDEAGNYRGYRGVVRDVTEQRRADRVLAESEKRYRELVENARDVIFSHNLKGYFETLNRHGEELFGCPREEVKELTIADVVAPEYLELVREKNAAKLNGAELTVYEIEALTRRERRIAVEVSSWLIYDENGQPVGVQGIARDITERKRAERALAESEKRYRELVENAQDVIYTQDLQGNVLTVNRCGAELLGYRRQDAKNFKLTDIVASEYLEDARRMRDFKLDGKGLAVHESELLASDGRRVPVEISSWVIYDENGQPAGFQGIARDITDRRRAESDRLVSQQRLRDLSAHLLSVREEERKKLARELHDELGQILTALKIDLVRLGEKLSGAKRNSLAFEIKDKPLEMLSIIDGAMDTTRKIVAELRPGVLDELGLAAAVEWQTMEFQKRTGIKCRLAVEFSENATCINHKTAVFRIFQECLTNVARHSGATEVRILLRNEPVRLFLEVEDDGRGITERETNEPHKFGILGMRERASLLDGTFDISRVSETGGTRVKVSVPCPLGGVI